MKAGVIIACHLTADSDRKNLVGPGGLLSVPYILLKPPGNAGPVHCPPRRTAGEVWDLRSLIG